MERLLAADPDAFDAAPTAIHERCETLKHLPAPGIGGQPSFVNHATGRKVPLLYLV
jgi:hypothetical protein